MIEEDIRDLEERLEELENALKALHLIERGPNPQYAQFPHTPHHTYPILPDRPPLRSPRFESMSDSELSRRGL